MNKLTRTQIADAILNDTKATRDQMLAAFPAAAKDLTDGLGSLYDRLADLDNSLPHDTRTAWAMSFLFSAANSLLTSIHLLLNGYLVPSGNSMRHWSEALAMALLCSDSRIDVLKTLDANPKHFPVQKALDFLSRDRNARILSISKTALHKFQRTQDLYQKYSHASALSVAAMFKMSDDGGVIIGSEFDSGKLKAYQDEISRRISACSFSLHITAVAERHLLRH